MNDQEISAESETNRKNRPSFQHGLRRIAGGFPLSLRLIREIHAILLRGGRGANRTQGEFRRSQN